MGNAGSILEVSGHMKKGGCFDEFSAAKNKCRPVAIKGRRSNSQRVHDDEGCIRATAALRKCFGRNVPWFEDEIARMDHGLDEDLKPSPEQVSEERSQGYRWWTGLRRS